MLLIGTPEPWPTNVNDSGAAFIEDCVIRPVSLDWSSAVLALLLVAGRRQVAVAGSKLAVITRLGGVQFSPLQVAVVVLSHKGEILVRYVSKVDLLEVNAKDFEVDTYIYILTTSMLCFIVHCFFVLILFMWIRWSLFFRLWLWCRKFYSHYMSFSLLLYIEWFLKMNYLLIILNIVTPVGRSSLLFVVV